MRLAALGVLLGSALFAGGQAAAVQCEQTSFEGVTFTICEVDPRTEDLRLFHTDADGALYGGFSAIDAGLDGSSLAFAMNAGMYHADRSPVGHYKEDLQEIMRVITSAGPGNFGLLPNGILCITDTSARVYETSEYVAQAPACRDATQSGPMLVIDGQLHPRFLADSTSRYVRNGVGTTNEGDKAVFAISQQPVTFHTFGRFYRDHLNLPQALYFDGNVSRLHAPQLNRSDLGVRLGPIVGVVE